MSAYCACIPLLSYRIYAMGLREAFACIPIVFALFVAVLIGFNYDVHLEYVPASGFRLFCRSSCRIRWCCCLLC